MKRERKTVNVLVLADREASLIVHLAAVFGVERAAGLFEQKRAARVKVRKDG